MIASCCDLQSTSTLQLLNHSPVRSRLPVTDCNGLTCGSIVLIYLEFQAASSSVAFVMNHDLISYGLNVLPDLKGDQFQIDLAVDSVDIMCLVRFRFGEETSGMVWSELDVFSTLRKRTSSM